MKFKVDGPGRFHSVMTRLKSDYRVAPGTLNETLPTLIHGSLESKEIKSDFPMKFGSAGTTLVKFI